jgi:hypothetical protein
MMARVSGSSAKPISAWRGLELLTRGYSRECREIIAQDDEHMRPEQMKNDDSF